MNETTKQKSRVESLAIRRVLEHSLMMTQEANKPTIMMICFKAIQVFLISTPQNCKQTRPVTSLNMTRKIKRGMIKKESLVQERSYLMGAHR